MTAVGLAVGFCVLVSWWSNRRLWARRDAMIETIASLSVIVVSAAWLWMDVPAGRAGWSAAWGAALAVNAWVLVERTILRRLRARRWRS